MPPLSPSILQEAVEQLDHPEDLDFDEAANDIDAVIRGVPRRSLEPEMSAEDFILRMGYEGAFLSNYRIPPAVLLSVRGEFAKLARDSFHRAQEQLHRKKSELLRKHEALLPEDKLALSDSNTASLARIIYQSPEWKRFCRLYRGAIEATTTDEVFDHIDGNIYTPRSRFLRENLASSAWPNPNERGCEKRVGNIYSFYLTL